MEKAVALRESLSQILMVNFGKYIPGKIWGMAARGKRPVEAGYGVEEITRTSYLEQKLLLLTGFALALVAAGVAFGNPIFWLGFVLSLTAEFLAGFLALFATGGVGRREGVGAALLTSVVTLEEAVLLMLLFRVWVVAAELIAGAVVLVSAGKRGTSTGAGVDGYESD